MKLSSLLNEKEWDEKKFINKNNKIAKQRINLNKEYSHKKRSNDVVMPVEFKTDDKGYIHVGFKSISSPWETDDSLNYFTAHSFHLNYKRI